MNRVWCVLAVLQLAAISAFGQADPSSVGDEIAFDNVPPNATVSVLDKAKGELATAIVALKSPRFDGNRLTFTVEKRDGGITGANGPASVFIDVVNVPLARLTTRQGGWYAGAK